MAGAIAAYGPRLPVPARRIVTGLADAHELDVWVCEACGETGEEALCAYEVRRRTRRWS